MKKRIKTRDETDEEQKKKIKDMTRTHEKVITPSRGAGKSWDLREKKMIRRANLKDAIVKRGGAWGLSLFGLLSFGVIFVLT